MNSSAIAGRARRRISRSPEAACRGKFRPETHSPRPCSRGVLFARSSGAALGEAPECERIDAMLDLKHTRGQRVGRIAGQYGHARLFDDRARIELRHYEVHRCAVLLRSGRKRALMGVKSLERGQERGMNVDQAPVPAGDEPWAEHVYKQKTAYDIDAVGLKRRVECAIKRFAVLAEWIVVDDFCRHSSLTRAGQPRGVRHVGEN